MYFELLNYKKKKEIELTDLGAPHCLYRKFSKLQLGICKSYYTTYTKFDSNSLNYLIEYLWIGIRTHKVYVEGSILFIVYFKYYRLI